MTSGRVDQLAQAMLERWLEDKPPELQDAYVKSRDTIKGILNSKLGPRSALGEIGKTAVEIVKYTVEARGNGGR